MKRSAASVWCPASDPKWSPNTHTHTQSSRRCEDRRCCRRWWRCTTIKEKEDGGSREDEDGEGGGGIWFTKWLRSIVVVLWQSLLDRSSLSIVFRSKTNKFFLYFFIFFFRLVNHLHLYFHIISIVICFNSHFDWRIGNLFQQYLIIRLSYWLMVTCRLQPSITLCV